MFFHDRIITKKALIKCFGISKEKETTGVTMKKDTQMLKSYRRLAVFSS